jgi:quercetin dioxygenase-like cupin family protein
MQNFQDFEAAALAQGFDETLVRVWAPAAEVGEHTHPFRARAVVVAGEMWLTVGADTRHVGVGEGFELDALVPHSERYGAEGATYWVARQAVSAAQSMK